MAGEIRLSTQALASSLVNSIIANTAVDGRTIAAAAVIGSHVSAGVIVSSHIATNAVVGAHISAGVVVGSHIAAAAVIGSHVSAGVIVSSHIATNAIVGAHISAGVIVGSHIASGTIAASNLAFAVANMIWNEVPAGTVNGTNQVYTMATAPTGYNVLPFINGVKINRLAVATDNTSLANFYMASTGATLYTIGAPPAVGEIIEVTYAY